MRSPGRELVSLLTEEDFADWVWEYATKMLNVENIIFVDGVNVYEDKDVASFFQKAYFIFCPESSKVLFRKSIGRLFLKYSQELNDENVDIFHKLIYLVGNIHAKESLRDIAKCLGTGDFESRYPGFSYSFFLCANLIMPRIEAHEAILMFVNSENFNDEYLLFALKSIVASAPSNQYRIFSEYEERLNKLYSRAVLSSGEDTKAFVKYLAKVFDNEKVDEIKSSSIPEP